MRELTFGFSPCPNDTFAFHALVHGLIDAPCQVRPVLLDIEELNRQAHMGAFDTEGFLAMTERFPNLYLDTTMALTPLADPYLGGDADGIPTELLLRYLQLQREFVSQSAAQGRVVIPGRETTAFRLLRLAAPQLSDIVEVRYDRILGAVEAGDVDAGLIIHESRFTYEAHGLSKVVDLGDWWEGETGLPVPLAGICARADLDAAVVADVERAIRASVQYAFDHPEASRAYVRANSQEMSDEVCDAHIKLYVNELSLDVGDEGLRAIARLTAPFPA